MTLIFTLSLKIPTGVGIGHLIMARKAVPQAELPLKRDIQLTAMETKQDILRPRLVIRSAGVRSHQEQLPKSTSATKL